MKRIMDFSSLNPISTNALNLAARKNEVKNVSRLLKKINPNCIDNRGWTCLHEAAAHDSYQSLLLILKHPECRPLAETHEGHTALYLACRNKTSIQTIQALLDSEEDIANYGSTECVTPLHVVSSQGRTEIIQLLIDYGAIINIQDFDGDTPLHEAVQCPEALTVLLYAGADPEIKNDTNATVFHMACFKGCYESAEMLFPFVSDINQVTFNGDTPLILATQGFNEDIIIFLLKHGADPHILNSNGDSALDVALNNGYSNLFKIILFVIEKDKMNPNIILYACKPHYFRFEIIENLLNYELGPTFFDFFEPFHVILERIGDIRPVYSINSPLNSFLNICEYIYCHSHEKFYEFFLLFLMRGVSVDALSKSECPPLVYIHYCAHAKCFQDVFKILQNYGCNVDYCSTYRKSHQTKVPDAFIASLTSDPSTVTVMLPYSLQCEPGELLQFSYENGILSRIPMEVQLHLISMIGIEKCTSVEMLPCIVPSLKHLSRLQVRSTLRNNGPYTTKEFLDIIEILHIPRILKYYLCYKIY